MNNITEPLQLAVGSHQPDSGKGCAMNVISWENGDIVITDLPQCTEPVLAAMIQAVNDAFCIHDGTEDTQRLCPACSVQVLALAHHTVETKLIEGTSPVVIKGRLHLDEDLHRWLFELQKVVPIAVRGSRFRWIYLDLEQIAEQVRTDRSLTIPHQIIDHFKAHFGLNEAAETDSPALEPETPEMAMLGMPR